MGISRDSRHKRRLTGGRRNVHQKKRKGELGRPAAMTKLDTTKRVHPVRVRGGNVKYRALRLESGNFAWASEGFAHKVRILDVVYNASNNELVRTKTLVKNAIVEIDAAPFRDFIDSRYGLSLGKKKAAAAKAGEEKKEEVKHNKNYAKVQAARLKARLVGLKDKKDHIDEALKERFNSGRLLACISSRPGQSGRADGYILEGKELDFYVKKLKTKK